MPSPAKPRLPPPPGPVDVFVLAGEHSGDAHAAAMVTQLRRVQPEVSVAAVGGPALAQAGAFSLFDLTRFAVVGLFEVLKHYRFFAALMDALVAWIAEHRPPLVCLVDYPGFNLRLAKRLGVAGISCQGGGSVRVVQYISPQLWAWKQHRRFTMASWYDGLAAIFPFEKQVYADTRLPVTVVRHPLAAPDTSPSFVYDEAGPLLLLPGSRRQAVHRIFPRMLATLAKLRLDGHAIEAVALFPSEELRDVLTRTCQDLDVPLALHPVDHGRPHRARAALMSSGTVSLEIAWAGIPGRLIYVAHPLTYHLGKRMVKVPYLGMANLLLHDAVWPEFIQTAATPERLAKELASLLVGSSERTRAAQAATRLHDLLASGKHPLPGAWLADQLPAKTASLGRSPPAASAPC